MASKNRGVSALKTVAEVIDWCHENLHYRNVDGWDAAPPIETVIADGYGDCKMLAGVVSALLEKVGQQHLYLVIKRRYWHMFVAYRSDSWRVVENARLLPNRFADLAAIKRHFEVDRFEKQFVRYRDFRKWFNERVYPKRSPSSR